MLSGPRGLSKPAAAFFVAVTCVLGLTAIGPAFAADDEAQTQTSAPGTSNPETTVPETTVPETTTPDTTVPATTTPEKTSTTVAAAAPETTDLDAETPSTQLPTAEPLAAEPTTVFVIDTNRVASANDLFIAGAYQELLERSVDPDGAAFWLNSILAGGDRSREELANKLLFSPEGASNEVVEAYADLLNRFPDRSGWDHWNVLLQSHRVDELRVLIMTSDEYVLINGGPSNYVNSLYIELLGRPAEPDGLAYWQGELNAGVPRKVIVEAIYRSDEGLGGRANAYYQRFNGRNATTQERSEGVALIRVDGERTLAAKVFASDESFETYFDAVFDTFFDAVADPIADPITDPVTDPDDEPIVAELAVDPAHAIHPVEVDQDSSNG